MRSTEVDEIVGGTAGRVLAFGERIAWMSACNQCNFHDSRDATRWSIQKKLALKLLRDPKHFDLPGIARLRGRAPTSIELADVVPYLTLAVY
jgi:allophanate hydrolase subunit 2